MSKIKLDRVIAVILLIFTSIVALYSIFIIHSMPTLKVMLFSYSFFAFCGALAFITKKGNINCAEKREKQLISKQANKLSMIFFFILVILITFILNSSIYVKPLQYYILISLAAVCIWIQIFSVRNSESFIDKMILLQILLFAAILRLSTYVINPYLVGPDSYYHYYRISEIIDSGHLSQAAQHYYYHPFYHLTHSISQIVVSNSIDIFSIINGFMSILLVIVIFLIGSEVIGKRAGLISAFLISILTMHLFLTIFNPGKIGGTTLLFLSLYALIKFNKFSNKLKLAILFWIPGIAVFFWHPEISVALMMILGGIFIVNRFITNESIMSFQDARKHKNGEGISFRKITYFAPFLSYIMLFVAYMMFVNYNIFTTIVEGVFIEKESTGLIQNMVGYEITNGFILQTFFAYIGITYLLFFGTYSGLNWLNQPTKNKYMILSSIIFIHLIPVAVVISGHFALNPARTLAYASILMVLLASDSIGNIFKFTSRPKVALNVIFIFVIVFFSTSSYIVGDNNNVMNSEIPVQTIITTQSNVAIYSFLVKIPHENIISSDYETLRVVSDSIRGLYHLPHKIKVLDPLSDVIVVNNRNIRLINWESSSMGENMNHNLNYRNKLYDNEVIFIYY
jgi:hypothetical protein